VSKTTVVVIGYYLRNNPALLLSQNLVPDLFLGSLLCEINECSEKDIEVVGMKIMTIQKGGEK